jgi:hypothetical protein
MRAGVLAPTRGGSLGHDRIQASFVSHLIQRRKLYRASMHRPLTDLLTIRHKADYSASHMIGKLQALHDLEIHSRVDVVMEERLAVVAPGQDMIEGPREFDPWLSRHAHRLESNAQYVNTHA